MNTPSAARLQISVAENVIVNLDASLKPGDSGVVIAEVPGDGVFTLLRKEMPCAVNDRQGRISGIQRNGKKRLLEVIFQETPGAEISYIFPDEALHRQRPGAYAGPPAARQRPRPAARVAAG